MASIEVDILPPQGQKLAPTHPAVERHHDEWIERGAAQRLKYELHLCWQKDFNLERLHAWRVDYGGDIARDDTPLSGVLEHYMHDPMQLKPRPVGQPGAGGPHRWHPCPLNSRRAGPPTQA